MFQPSTDMDATAISGLFRSGKTTPLDVLATTFEWATQSQGSINAFCHLDVDGAKLAAQESAARWKAGSPRSAIEGLPIAVKDNLFVKGIPARWGSLLFEDHVPNRDDIAIERLRVAGAVIVGKTTTPELSLTGRTESRLSGVTRNPWDTDLTPGGSSGGSVVAVASGIVPLSLSTDAGGSTRMPASYTGLFGLRPSTSRIPRRFGFPALTPDFQAIGLLARSMRDIELAYEVLAGPDPRDPLSNRIPGREANRNLRIGYLVAVDQLGPDREVEEVLREVVGVLASSHSIREVDAPFSAARLAPIWRTLASAGVAAVVEKFSAAERTKLTEAVAAAAGVGQSLSASDYADAYNHLSAYRSDVSAAWGDYDILLMPTAPAPAWDAELVCPPVIGGEPGSVDRQGMYCGWVNALGYPALNIPFGVHLDGRPIGVQAVAPMGGEAALFTLGRFLEANRKPVAWPFWGNSSHSKLSVTRKFGVH